MPSESAEKWKGTRAANLDKLEEAHGALGGTGSGRRYALEHLNHVYLVSLCGNFQGFARDLLKEAIGCIVDHTVPVPAHRPLIRTAMTSGLYLNKSNPTTDVLRKDFRRLGGFDLWAAAETHHASTKGRRKALERLVGWRNAVAHQDFDGKNLIPSVVQLKHVRDWRSKLSNLVKTMDVVVAEKIRNLTGTRPW